VLEYLLFDTRVGEWLLGQFERRTGLVIVRSELVTDQRIRPMTLDQQPTSKLEATVLGS
jgi:hypothetical protein